MLAVIVGLEIGKHLGMVGATALAIKIGVLSRALIHGDNYLAQPHLQVLDSQCYCLLPAKLSLLMKITRHQKLQFSSRLYSQPE